MSFCPYHRTTYVFGVEMSLPKLVGFRRGVLFALAMTCVALCWQCGQQPASQSRNPNGTPLASSFRPPFEIAALNDGTPAPWGSSESAEDTYAGIAFPDARAVRIVRITAFSPENRPHLRDISVVTADSTSPKPAWLVVRARIQGSPNFSTKVTVPPLADQAVVTLEVDPTDPGAGPHKVWGIACFSSSLGYMRNYLSVGNGIYLRELHMQ